MMLGRDGPKAAPLGVFDQNAGIGAFVFGSTTSVNEQIKQNARTSLIEAGHASRDLRDGRAAFSREEQKDRDGNRVRRTREPLDRFLSSEEAGPKPRPVSRWSAGTPC